MSRALVPVRRRGPAVWPGVLIFAAAFAVLGVHTRRYLPFISDDALISLRYAKRLLQGHGLTWNAGERVEGYSNLLWVLASAALGGLGVDLVDAVRVLGYVCMGAALAAVVCALPPSNLRKALAVSFALLFLVLSGPFGAWTIGGMEQPLVAALLAWGVVLLYGKLEREGATAREMLVPGLFFALLCWARLDGPLFTAAAAAAILINEGVTRGALRKAVGLSLLPLLFVLLQVVFRLAYYGEWIPNTALVKFNPSGQHALDGWGYVRAGALAASPLLALAAASVFVSLRHNFRRGRMILLLALASSWAAYLVAIGGDIFPAWRHFVPLLVLLALMLTVGGEWAAGNLRARAYGVTLTAAALALVLFAVLQFRDTENLRAISERWEWDAEVVGLMLGKAFAEEQPLMAVDPAGGLPYWSELPALDMLGLNDHYLPRHPPPGLGQGPIAHELGDGQYVLSRRPDLVVFLLPTGNDSGYFLSGRQMQQDPRFFRDYTLVRFEGQEPYKVTSRIWVRRESERIGIRREPDRVFVPGFLICDNQTSRARLDAGGELVTPITKEQPALLKNFELPRGVWRVEVEAAPTEVRLRISPFQEEGDGARGGTDMMSLDARAPAVVDLRSAEGGRRLNVELTPFGDETIEVRGLTFTRVRE